MLSLSFDKLTSLTPRIFCFDKLEYVTNPLAKIFDEFGKEVIKQDNNPPVQDSANDNLIFFFKQSLKTFSAFFLILIGNIINLQIYKDIKLKKKIKLE